MEKTPSEWNKHFSPGDLVILIAQFKDNRPKHGVVIKEYSPQANPGYQVFVDGKVKYLPPYLIRVVSRAPA